MRGAAVARPGDRVSVADFVEWLEFQEISADALRYEICFRPRTILTREHVHPQQTELHEVVSGHMRLKVDGVIQTLTEGEAVVVPAGVRHAILPAGEGDVRMVFELRPPLRWEALIEIAGRLSEQRQRNWRGYVNPLLLALLATEFRPEVRATRPPAAVQDVVLRPLAAIARRRGYATRYLAARTTSVA
jgi:mannose-6-phosphate isomerase-like protein (cupin superfamily)